MAVTELAIFIAAADVAAAAAAAAVVARVRKTIATPAYGPIADWIGGGGFLFSQLTKRVTSRVLLLVATQLCPPLCLKRHHSCKVGTEKNID